jgi:hypothetical protein
MTWEPDLASPQLEEAMEAHDLPEGDCDEVRRFVEVLRRLRDRRAGKELAPAPEGMRDWILGKD